MTFVSAQAHPRTIAQLGFPNGVSLEGVNAERIVSFRLPARAPLDSARLHLSLRFSRMAAPESNLQVFVNTLRLAVATRSDADSTGAYAMDVAIPASLTSGDFLSLTFRSAVASTADRCYDQRLGLGYVEIEPTSYFAYFAPTGAITTIGQAWAAFPDTIRMSLPNRRLTAQEFRAAYVVGIAASNEGRAVAYSRLPTLGDITIGTPADVAAADSTLLRMGTRNNISVAHFVADGIDRVGILLDARGSGSAASLLEPDWKPLTASSGLDVRTATRSARPRDANPTFADLGFSDLQQSISAEATWQLPIDLRDFSVGRVPSRVDLQIVTAPNTNDRQLVVFVFLNGTLVRSTDIGTAGIPQLLEVRLPSALLVTHNELRVVMQRHRPATLSCTEADQPIPAQILPSSRVVTTRADAATRTFTGVTAQMSETDPLYLPQRALDAPSEYLPLIISMSRAFWSRERAPTPTFYGKDSLPAPLGPFFVVGRPRVVFDAPLSADSGHFTVHRKDGGASVFDIADLSGWSVAQVVGWKGHLGVQILPSSGRPRLPDWPGAYGANSLVLADADTTLFQLNTSGPDAQFLFNDGPTIIDRIRGDWILWGVFLALVIVPPIILLLRAIVRRTPRRRLQRAPARGPGTPPAIP